MAEHHEIYLFDLVGSQRTRKVLYRANNILRLPSPTNMKLLPLILPLLSFNPSAAFVAPVPSRPITSLRAKSTSGQGFGKSTSKTVDESAVADDAPRGLQSISVDDSSPATNSFQTTNDLDSSDDDSSSMTPEQRSKSILRNKYSLISYEEQRAMEGDERALVDSQKKQIQREKLRNIEKLWPENADVFEVLPPSLLKGIDTALKVGLGACTLLFMLSGVFITIEAGSKATGNALPEGLDGWIVNVVEPNFTPLLGVLLGFSVSLGLFSAGMLGSKGSVYREDP
jgi:hypothetical protein